jgi:sigma-E factor negative regulatory protein RseB
MAVMCRLGLPVLLCLTTAQAAAVVPEELASMIAAIPKATQTLSYEGEFIYAHDTHLDAMRIVHSADHNSPAERLVSLSGPAREVVRRGDKVTCTFSDHRSVLVERRQPRDFVTLTLSEPVETIARHYEFKYLEDDRVAGRAARVIRIQPRKPDRHSYQLWVDAATNLLLRSAVIDGNGKVLEQVMFTEIVIGGKIPANSLEPEVDGEGFTWYTNEKQPTESRSGDEALRVRWVPEGFTLKELHTQKRASGRKPVHHVVYSDGLAMVSVFVEEISTEEPPLQGYSTLGAVNAFSRLQARHQVTVVGEVPQATVRRIAESVSIRTDDISAR